MINWGGQFDLVVTSGRIHLMLPIKSFELPKEEVRGKRSSIGCYDDFCNEDRLQK